MLLIFIAAICIIIGIYEQKLEIAEQNKEIEYRFVPRTYYEEQMGNGGNVSDKFATMFDTESPWFDRTVGPIIDIPKPYAERKNAAK
jgi:hypothetical protein